MTALSYEWDANHPPDLEVTLKIDRCCRTAFLQQTAGSGPQRLNSWQKVKSQGCASCDDFKRDAGLRQGDQRLSKVFEQDCAGCYQEVVLAHLASLHVESWLAEPDTNSPSTSTSSIENTQEPEQQPRPNWADAALLRAWEATASEGASTLTQQQRFILSHLLDQCTTVVSGNQGTGKTLVLATAARHFATLAASGALPAGLRLLVLTSDEATLGRLLDMFSLRMQCLASCRAVVVGPLKHDLSVEARAERHVLGQLCAELLRCVEEHSVLERLPLIEKELLCISHKALSDGGDAWLANTASKLAVQASHLTDNYSSAAVEQLAEALAASSRHHTLACATVVFASSGQAVQELVASQQAFQLLLMDDVERLAPTPSLQQLVGNADLLLATATTPTEDNSLDVPLLGQVELLPSSYLTAAPWVHPTLRCIAHGQWYIPEQLEEGLHTSTVEFPGRQCGGICWRHPDLPVMFLQAHHRDSHSTAHSSVAEARLALRVLVALSRDRSMAGGRLALLTATEAQRDLLRSRLWKAEPWLRIQRQRAGRYDFAVDVETVEGFRSRYADVVVFCAGGSHGALACSVEELAARAKRALLVAGDAGALCSIDEDEQMSASAASWSCLLGLLQSCGAFVPEAEMDSVLPMGLPPQLAVSPDDPATFLREQRRSQSTRTPGSAVLPWDSAPMLRSATL